MDGSSRGVNPFDDDDPVIPPVRHHRPRAAQATNNNPFDEDDNRNAAPAAAPFSGAGANPFASYNPFGSPEGVSSSAMRRSTTGTPASAVMSRSRPATTTSAADSNPFSSSMPAHGSGGGMPAYGSSNVHRSQPPAQQAAAASRGGSQQTTMQSTASKFKSFFNKGAAAVASGYGSATRSEAAYSNSGARVGGGGGGASATASASKNMRTPGSATRRPMQSHAPNAASSATAPARQPARSGGPATPIISNSSMKQSAGSVGVGGGGVRREEEKSSVQVSSSHPHRVGANVVMTTSAGRRVVAVDVSRSATKKGGLMRWPYDDYHLVQELYYDNLKKNPRPKPAQPSSPTSPNGDGENKRPSYSRPPDPPPIHHEVVGLPLHHFERKAEQRAINIISTWLIDAGLIDELLIQGAVKRDVSAGSKLRHSNSSMLLRGGGGGLDFSAILSASLEGSTKMNTEITKLRATTKRELNSINARLNDGVATSGSEVQELVDQVVATKANLKRLRFLCNNVLHNDDPNDPYNYNAHPFILNKYPHLKAAIHARQNIKRCFRELDYFGHIPTTCAKLRDELHAGEWTAHEWSTLRNVCRQHVELEIFLVEAEAGMKQRFGFGLGDGTSAQQYQRISATYNPNVVPHHLKEVDEFLSSHVNNVWELGDEIRLRVMSGIGSAFDLAINNPAGMVALVEAVEVYELANEEYKQLHAEQQEELDYIQKLRFHDMRAAALGELYKDMEVRCLEYFNDMTIQSNDEDDHNEDEVFSEQFNAVIKSANALNRETFIVKEQMAPCFPEYWFIETLWSTCMAHVCSSQILQQTGKDCHKLQDLSSNQLLKLVAWVESFREIIEDTFPNIGKFRSTKTYFDAKPNLLIENNKKVDIDSAQDSLAWVNNILWDVHDNSKDEFLVRFSEQSMEWLNNVYLAEHTKNQTEEGMLITSLCEDVYSLANVQISTVREHLTRKSEALAQAFAVMFKKLYDKQMESRNGFLTEFETCCAAANDFIRMSEKCEDMVEGLKKECDFEPHVVENLEEVMASLIGLYSNDALYAGQKTHIYIFEPIEEAIANDLFGLEWLNDLTHNELSLTLVRTLDDFMEDLEQFLGETMFMKTVETLVTASCIFYLRILLSKSNHHKSIREPYFPDCTLALNRMSGDISTIRKYFIDLSESSLPSLKRIIDREFALLDTIHEMMQIAAGCSESEARDFVLVIQKRIRNMQLTKFLLGDIWHLMNPADESNIYELIESMEEEMKVVAPTDEEAHITAADRSSVPGLRLDQMIAKHVADSRKYRRRPLKDSAMNRAETMLQGWKFSFEEKAAVVGQSTRNMADIGRSNFNTATMNLAKSANAAVSQLPSIGEQLPGISENQPARAPAARSRGGGGSIPAVSSYGSSKNSYDDSDNNPFGDSSHNKKSNPFGDGNTNPFGEEDDDDDDDNNKNPFDDDSDGENPYYQNNNASSNRNPFDDDDDHGLNRSGQADF